MASVRESLLILQDRIAQAANRAQRDPSEIQLLAVTKGAQIDRIMEAYALGLRDFGENYWQESKAKLEQTPSDSRWHFIGRLQTNKAKYLIGRFHWVCSVESLRQLQELQLWASKLEHIQSILIQIKVSEEPSKGGATVEGFDRLIDSARAMPNLKIGGVMAIPAYTDDPEAARPAFAMARQMFERLHRTERITLSMGMSHDLEAAITEGATQIRIGTALFGPRDR